jgi:betaine-aldehyde dehydrogenase
MNTQLYIDGQWIDSAETIAAINPATETVIAEVAAADAKLVDLAVQAARKAFVTWGKTTGQARADWLRAIANGIQARLDDLVHLEMLNTGKIRKEAQMDMEDAIACFEFYATQALGLDARQNTPIELPSADYQAVVRLEPIGVAGQIIPWNYPLLMMAWKLAPALAAGCTCVLKPSEVTPLTAIVFAEIVADIGLPPGVVNIVNGYGKTTGAALANHPGIDKLAFTGSVPTGSAIMQAAAVGIKNISLELGGKSPFIVFADADLDQVVEWVLFGIFWNKGENCCATSRLIVQDTIAPTLYERLKTACAHIPIGDPFAEDTLLGPLASGIQYQKVCAYLEQAKAEGLKLLTGGKRPDGLETGFYLEPTIFIDVPNTSRLWQEEIFGPLLCVCTFSDETEAIDLANDTDYGLGAAVISGDIERAQRVANALEAGVVWVNCSQPVFVNAPFGGVKQSGIGRELGIWGLDNYLEVKQVLTYVSQSPLGWYTHLG